MNSSHSPRPLHIRESSSLVKVHKNFKETNTIKPGFTIEGIHGGPVLALRGQDFVCFYDWNQCKVCRLFG